MVSSFYTCTCIHVHADMYTYILHTHANLLLHQGVVVQVSINPAPQELKREDQEWVQGQHGLCSKSSLTNKTEQDKTVFPAQSPLSSQVHFVESGHRESLLLRSPQAFWVASLQETGMSTRVWYFAYDFSDPQTAVRWSTLLRKAFQSFDCLEWGSKGLEQVCMSGREHGACSPGRYSSMVRARCWRHNKGCSQQFKLHSHPVGWTEQMTLTLACRLGGGLNASLVIYDL